LQNDAQTTARPVSVTGARRAAPFQV